MSALAALRADWSHGFSADSATDGADSIELLRLLFERTSPEAVAGLQTSPRPNRGRPSGPGGSWQLWSVMGTSR